MEIDVENIWQTLQEEGESPPVRDLNVYSLGLEVEDGEAYLGLDASEKRHFLMAL